MNPLTVLLWLLCAFLVIGFFGGIGLLIYMIKSRRKAIKEFNDSLVAMGLKPHKAFTKGTSHKIL
jgi:hypothetical protein